MNATAENKQQIANTILAQLGGNKFLAMTGAYNLLIDGNGLRMKLRKNQSGAGIMRVTLKGDDTYKMEFIKARTVKCEIKITTVREFDGIYFDQLQSRFTEVTGYYTHL